MSPAARGRLVQLLAGSFSVDELRDLLQTHPAWETFGGDLPDGRGAPKAFAHDVVEVLDRHGLLSEDGDALREDALAQLLIDARPARYEEVKALFPGSTAPRPRLAVGRPRGRSALVLVGVGAVGLFAVGGTAAAVGAWLYFRSPDPVPVVSPLQVSVNLGKPASPWLESWLGTCGAGPDREPKSPDASVVYRRLPTTESAEFVVENPYIDAVRRGDAPKVPLAARGGFYWGLPVLDVVLQNRGADTLVLSSLIVTILSVEPVSLAVPVIVEGEVGGCWELVNIGTAPLRSARLEGVLRRPERGVCGESGSSSGALSVALGDVGTGRDGRFDLTAALASQGFPAIAPMGEPDAPVPPTPAYVQAPRAGLQETCLVGSLTSQGASGTARVSSKLTFDDSQVGGPIGTVSVENVHLRTDAVREARSLPVKLQLAPDEVESVSLHLSTNAWAVYTLGLAAQTSDNTKIELPPLRVEVFVPPAAAEVNGLVDRPFTANRYAETVAEEL